MTSSLSKQECMIQVENLDNSRETVPPKSSFLLYTGERLCCSTCQAFGLLCLCNACMCSCCCRTYPKSMPMVAVRGYAVIPQGTLHLSHKEGLGQGRTVVHWSPSNKLHCAHMHLFKFMCLLRSIHPLLSSRPSDR